MKINKNTKLRFYGKNKSALESSENDTYFTAPDEDTNNAVTVEYNNTESGKLPGNPENRVEIVYGTYDFHFRNLYNFMPPKQNFYNLLNELEKDHDELIWIKSLFFKHGIITGETLSMTERYIWEESLYFFYFDGIPGYWMYDDGMCWITHFAVDADYYDKKKYVAEGLRKVIETDGINITIEDWEKVKTAQYNALSEKEQNRKKSNRMKSSRRKKER